MYLFFTLEQIASFPIFASYNILSMNDFQRFCVLISVNAFYIMFLAFVLTIIILMMLGVDIMFMMFFGFFIFLLGIIFLLENIFHIFDKRLTDIGFLVNETIDYIEYYKDDRVSAVIVVDFKRHIITIRGSLTSYEYNALNKELECIGWYR